jgi:hypothetical protein
VEERSAFRSTKLASASGLSISAEKASHPWDSLWWWSVGFSRCSVREEYQSMRSARCASAPSHPLHVMPSRITRNSHRPRASDRTMVASEAPARLPLSQTRRHRHYQRRNSAEWTTSNFSREAKLQWAGSRETISLSGRGRVFFLTSLFIELIDRKRVLREARPASMRAGRKARS